MMMMMMMMMMSSSSSHCITQVGVASPLPRTRKNTRSLRFCFESWFCPKAKRKRHDDDDDDDTKSSSINGRKRALLSTRHHFSMRSFSTQSDTMTTMNPESNVSLDVASFPAVRVKLSIDLLLGFKILNTIVLLLLLIGD